MKIVCIFILFQLYLTMKKEKESWINNFLNFQLVFGSARFQGNIVKNGRIQRVFIKKR